MAQEMANLRDGAEPSSEDRLNSWKEIAAYLKCSERTVRRWEQEGLPVHRHPHKVKAAIYAYKAEIDAWWCDGRDRLKRIQDVQEHPRSVATPPWMRSRAILAAAALLLVLAVVWVLRQKFDSRKQPTVGREFTYTQITNFTDSAVAPALSPDGRMVAFYRSNSWFLTPDQIYVKLLPNGEPVQLTNDPKLKYGLSFSPDGSRLAYTTYNAATDEWKTFTVSPLGGESTLLLSNAAGLNWLDQHRVLFSEIESAPHMGIVTATENRSDYRKVYFPQHQRMMAHFSYASPDKQWALVAEMDPVWQPCRLISLRGGSESRQVGPQGQCNSAAWSPDGKWMYFGAEVEGSHHLWRQRLTGGQPEQITFGPTEEDGLAMAPDGRFDIAYVGQFSGPDWEIYASQYDSSGNLILGGIGINIGGTVHVKPIEDWFRLAEEDFKRIWEKR